MPNTLIWIPKRLVELGLVNVAARSPEAFIDYCEQDYAARVEHAATCVRESGAHVVMLTGPSASGKTTTAHKLADCIAAHGRRSAVVSLDNFYKDLKDYPRLPDGSVDYESVDALDISAINRCLLELIRTGRTQIPDFDFCGERRRHGVIPVEVGDGVVVIEGIHAQYAAAGSRIINTNTFGASAHKLAKSPYTVEEVIAAGVACCKRACAPYGALTALDIGPLGELLEPNGTLPFETAVSEYARIVRAGVAAGADLVVVETFTDLYELKAALLAVKENCDLPVLASMSFEARGRTFTGCTVESFAATARGLGADALGINCSLGPQEIFPMAKRLAEALPGDFPVFVKPNAGLPRADGSGYDITPELFAQQMTPYRDLGLFAAGGCCGTTPDFIRLLNDVFRDCVPGRAAHPMPSVICSPVECVTVDGVTVVGERINPTGKKRFQQALRQNDMDYVLEQAVSQAEAGAQLLDVNVGTPEVDEPAMLEQVVKTLQSVVSQPLQLDSTNFEALERALRAYNGKPIVNSVNGAPAVLGHVLPLCKKYGAAVIGLTRALAKEVGPSGVRVNCVAPGVISTDMNRSLSEADFAALREETPLGVIGSPEETADAIWYFTACASFVTGQVLGVNGGMVI